ncbi:MAG: hypothetical protein ABR583_03190 [Gaiellaceae bacterium]
MLALPYLLFRLAAPAVDLGGTHLHLCLVLRSSLLERGGRRAEGLFCCRLLVFERSRLYTRLRLTPGPPLLEGRCAARQRVLAFVEARGLLLQLPSAASELLLTAAERLDEWLRASLALGHRRFASLDVGEGRLELRLQVDSRPLSSLKSVIPTIELALPSRSAFPALCQRADFALDGKTLPLEGLSAGGELAAAGMDQLFVRRGLVLAVAERLAAGVQLCGGLLAIVRRTLELALPSGHGRDPPLELGGGLRPRLLNGLQPGTRFPGARVPLLQLLLEQGEPPLALGERCLLLRELREQPLALPGGGADVRLV